MERPSLSRYKSETEFIRPTSPDIHCWPFNATSLYFNALLDVGCPKDEHPSTVRVPLNKMAAEIISKYEDDTRVALLPFISPQKYNNAIKKIFLAARLTRPVTILDPITRQEVQRPLNEIASSHLARRTFIGNLYKQVKDPNLIAKLSGHVEGSKAFARYRDIDEEMRKDLVKLLE